MSDLLEDAEPQLTVPIGDDAVPIAELNLYDRADLQRADREAFRQRVRDDCRDIGATEAETYQELEAFRDRRWGDAEWIAMANSIDGQLAILERALEKANAGKGRALVEAIRWPDGDRMKVAARVAGLRLAPAGELPDDAEPEGQGSDPHPRGETAT